MKKFICLFVVCFLTFLSFASAISAKTLNCGAKFDWINNSQVQKNNKVNQIREILFNKNTKLKYSSKQFKYEYKPYLRDKMWKDHYIAIVNGIREDNEKQYSGFFHGNTLYSYAFQYNDNPYRVFYYDAMGHLRYIDFISPQYPKFPYYSAQYSISGDLIGTIYFVSKDEQYIFKPNKKFKGVWYMDKMYNIKGKVILTRTNW